MHNNNKPLRDVAREILRQDLSCAMDEQNDMMDILLEKSKTIEESINNIAKATSKDLLVKFTRREERALRNSFSCVICKGW